jgi:hypothetical protein
MNKSAQLLLTINFFYTFFTICAVISIRTNTIRNTDIVKPTIATVQTVERIALIGNLTLRAGESFGAFTSIRASSAIR